MKDIDILKNNNVDIDKSLEIFGDMATYDEMLQSFYSEIDSKLNDIIKFKESGDMANYAIKVHSLKSDCKYFGFTQLAELSYKHELESKANNIYFVYDNFEQLIDEVRKVIYVVGQYLGLEIIKEEIQIINRDKKLLVVDDSQVIRNYVNSIFANQFEVISATDGADALSRINNDLKIMFLDLNMPNVDGFEVLEYLSKNNIKIPVVVITGIGDEEAIKKVENYNIIGILRKPFNEKALKKLIDGLN